MVVYLLRDWLTNNLWLHAVSVRFRGNEIGEAAQGSRSYNDGVVLTSGKRRNKRRALALPAGFDQFFCHVARDFERLGNGSALCYKTRQIIRCREVNAFGQLFNVNLQRQFHLTPL